MFRISKSYFRQKLRYGNFLFIDYNNNNLTSINENILLLDKTSKVQENSRY